MSLLGQKPIMANDVFVAPSATVVGNVQLYDQSSVWYGASIMGDCNEVILGGVSNLQERSVIVTGEDC